jgi:hypothetical protein
MIVPMVEIHADRAAARFTLIPFVRNPAGLSVTSGNFLEFEREIFRKSAFGIVKACLTRYHTDYDGLPSQFDKMSLDERKTFFNGKVAFLVSERTTDLWWISLMKPVRNGTDLLPIGPQARVSFQPSQDAARFFDLLLALIPPAQA